MIVAIAAFAFGVLFGGLVVWPMGFDSGLAAARQHRDRLDEAYRKLAATPRPTDDEEH